MTADKTGEIEISVSAQNAYDAFVGFIYATTIALVIKTAYLQSGFNSPVPVLFTLLLLAFFAQDWVVRFSGRLQMLGKTTTKPIPFFFKLLIEITIVYFLLLTSLRVIEIFAPLTYAKIVQPFQESGWKMLNILYKKTPDAEVCYMTAAFSIISGIWNLVMIAISMQVKKRHICSLLKGHLDDDIIKLFPIFKELQDKSRDWRKQTEEEFIKAVKDYAKDAADIGRDDIKSKPTFKQLGKGYRAVRWGLALKFLKYKPIERILPYLFVFHIVILNFVLGFFILFSALFLRGDGFAAWHPFFHVFLFFLFFVGASSCLAFHLMSNNSQALYERLAFAFLGIAIFLFYSMCPVIVLILLVVAQQIAANIFMTTSFDPSKAYSTESLEGNITKS